MIESRVFHAIKCDRCGEYEESGFMFYEDKDDPIDNAFESDWMIAGDSHYCPDCWMYNDKDEKVILKPYPEHLKEVLKFLKTLDGAVKIVEDTKDYFGVRVDFYRKSAPRSLRKHEENYINNLALGKIIMIDNRYNSSLIRVAAE